MTTTTKATKETEMDDLVGKILEVVRSLDSSGERSVNLGHYLFDRLPCTRRKLYCVARKNAEQWGYEYHNSEYVPSGNRAFQRNHKRGYRTNCMLYRIRPNVS